MGRFVVKSAGVGKPCCLSKLTEESMAIFEKGPDQPKAKETPDLQLYKAWLEGELPDCLMADKAEELGLDPESAAVIRAWKEWEERQYTSPLYALDGQDTQRRAFRALRALFVKPEKITHPMDESEEEESD